jgi:hypothetical protein
MPITKTRHSKKVLDVNLRSLTEDKRERRIRDLQKTPCNFTYPLVFNNKRAKA